MVHKRSLILTNVFGELKRKKNQKDYKFIAWNQCTVAYKAAIEALDQTLQALRHNNKLMGGVTLVLAGDFHQMLPILL